MTSLALFLMAVSAFAQAEPVTLSARDRERIDAAFRATWPGSYSVVRRYVSNTPVETPELRRVEVVGCRGVTPGRYSLPGCDLVLTIRDRDGREQTFPFGWRFARTQEGEWVDPSIFFGLPPISAHSEGKD